MKLFAKILTAIALLTGFASVNAPVQAQEVQKIVAIVNDDVISGYDVIQRINLNIFMAGLPANNRTRQQLVPSVIKTLIDDQLKLQEAKRRNTEASDQEINRAIEQFEQRFNIRPGKFEEALATIRVDPETVIHQIRATIGWDKLIRRRIVPRINVTEAEIKSKQEELRANKGKNEYRIREIFLPIEVASKEPEIRQNAENLAGQLKQGANFARVAAQFSEGPTAANGGLVGWQMAEEMAPEIARSVAKLEPGKISEPIRTRDGYYIVAVEDIRKILGESSSDALMELAQIVVPLKPAEDNNRKDSQTQLAKTVSSFVNGCEYLQDMASEMVNNESGKMGRVQLSNLPDKFRNLVENLEEGEASDPFLDEDKYRIFIVCNRTDTRMQSDSEEAIRQLIGNKRIEARARRYLNDLRREASIESR